MGIPDMAGPVPRAFNGAAPIGDTYTLHDCSSAIVADGRAAKVPGSFLRIVSNRRGLVVG